MSAPPDDPAPPTTAVARTLLAPAKLNLGLRVVGRRPDGYHLIESVFVPVDLFDELTLAVSRRGAGSEPREGDSPEVALDVVGEFESEPDPPSSDQRLAADVPPGGANLATRAAHAFLAHAGVDQKVRISLRKRIPVGAGMGGGSSDAGAVLRGLAEVCGVAKASLAELALGLGADVPYFLDPRPALVSGIGERIEPLPGLARLSFLLVNPGISLATADVFRAFDAARGSLTLARPGSTMRALSRLRSDSGALSGSLAELLVNVLVNDLEAAAVRLCPQIAELREKLRGLGADATGMSGSGATVFGLFPSAAAAQEARESANFGPTVWARVVESVEVGMRLDRTVERE